MKPVRPDVSMNRLANLRNSYQGKARRVLCVCSAGLLRSPTAALILAVNFGYNTRAAGLEADFALIPVDDALIMWADEIVCMNQEQADTIMTRVLQLQARAQIFSLNIPDQFAYMDPVLQAKIVENYTKTTNKTPNTANVPQIKEPS